MVTFERRWDLGEFEVNGLKFRVVRGKKPAALQGQEDYRLDVLTLAGWVPVRMELAFFVTDFFAENEEVLYPSPRNGGRHKGGAKFLEYVRFAANYGWARAAGLVRMDRINATAQKSLWDDRR